MSDSIAAPDSAPAPPSVDEGELDLAPLTFDEEDDGSRHNIDPTTGEQTNNDTAPASAALTSTERTVTKVIKAFETTEGVGARVRRSIGTAALFNLSPFLILDWASVGRGSGFPDHPHRGMCTLTYVLEGKMQHEDFLGHRGILSTGDAQWMTAGRGIVHSEMPYLPSESGSEDDEEPEEEEMADGRGKKGKAKGRDRDRDRDRDAPPKNKAKPLKAPKSTKGKSGKGKGGKGVDRHGEEQPVALQLWIDLPAAKKMVKPSYKDVRGSTYPVVEVPGGSVTVIAGEVGGTVGPVKPYAVAGLTFLDIRPSGPEGMWFDLPDGWTAFAYVLNGSVVIGDESEAVRGNDTADDHDEADGQKVGVIKAHHLAVLSSGPGQTGVRIARFPKTGKGETRVILVAGPPLDQPVVLQGPFAVTSREAAAQALKDYQSGRNGFENIGWRSKSGRDVNAAARRK